MDLVIFSIFVSVSLLAGFDCVHHHEEVPHEDVTNCPIHPCEGHHPSCMFRFHLDGSFTSECVPAHDCTTDCSSGPHPNECCCLTKACTSTVLASHTTSAPPHVAGHHHEVAHEDVTNCPGIHCEHHHPTCVLHSSNDHVRGQCVPAHDCVNICDTHTYESSYTCCCPFRNCVVKKLSLHLNVDTTTVSQSSTTNAAPVVGSTSPPASTSSVSCSTCSDVSGGVCSQDSVTCQTGEVCMYRISGSRIQSGCTLSNTCLNAQIQDLFQNTKTQCCLDSTCGMVFLSHASQIINYLNMAASTTMQTQTPEPDIAVVPTHTTQRPTPHPTTTTTTPMPTTTTTTTTVLPTTPEMSTTMRPLVQSTVVVQQTDSPQDFNVTTAAQCDDVDSTACAEFNNVYNICALVDGSPSEVALKQCRKTCNLCS